MIRYIVTALLVATFVGSVATAGVLLAQTFKDTQTSSGAINVTTESADLYICEPSGTTGDPDCPGDDSLADEAIFENTENLFPGQTASWNVRLRNVGTMPWDVSDVQIVPVETFDPGNDCDDLPIIGITTLELKDDDHIDLETNDEALPALPGFRTEQRHLITHVGFGNPYHWVTVHVAVGGKEDLKIRVTMPLTLAGECQDNVWDINIAWMVTPHP